MREGPYVLSSTPLIQKRIFDGLPLTVLFKQIIECLDCQGVQRCLLLDSGDTAYADPHRPHKSGDTCVFRSHVDDGSVTLCIKEIVRETDDLWHIKQHTPKTSFRLKKSEWQACHVIVGVFFRRRNELAQTARPAACFAVKRTVHFHMPGLMPWTTLYSFPRYCISS